MLQNGRRFPEYNNISLGRDANNGILSFANEISAALTSTDDKAIYWRGGNLYAWNGSAETNLLTGGAGGASTWDGLYDLDNSLTIDGPSLTFALIHATNDGVTFTGDSGSAGDVIQITNAGSGKDINGTSGLWSVSKAGVAVFAKVDLGDDEALELGASDDATIQWIGGSNFIDIAGATNFDGDMTIESGHPLVIAGTAGSDRFTITAGDAVMADGSLTITDADNAATVTVTNATVSSGNMVVITGDAVADGSILYIDNGGASLTTGYYINLNDDGVSDFTVGADGATKITTAVATTHALHITGVQTSQDMVTFDNTGGVIASDKAVLLLDAGGAVASGGNILRIAPTGTPNAGAIGIEFVGASKALNAMYIDADPTASDVVTILGGGALTDNNAVLTVMSDGALATGGNTFRVETAGTPASGAIYAEFNFTGITDTNENIGVKIDAGGKKVVGLHVDADPVANSAVYLTSGAALAADKATLEVVAVPTTNNADSAVVRLEQTHTAGGANILHMVQLDIDKPFFGFETTVGEGNALEAVGAKTLTTTHFVMVDIEGVGARYFPVGTIA